MTRDSMAHLHFDLNTGSPIEAMFLEALFYRAPCSIGVMAGRTLFYVRDDDEPMIMVTLQEPVGPYFADFSFRFTPAGAGPGPLLFVECDGHEYHERTPEQAEHDRARDRFFASKSLTVLRFTGREINRDADAVALEALRQFFQAAVKAKKRDAVMVDALRENGWLGFAAHVGLVHENATGDGFVAAERAA